MTLRLAFALLLTLSTPSLAAFDRGDVLLEHRTHIPALGVAPSYDLWTHFGWRYALLTAWRLIDKPIPFTGAGHFLVPAPNQVVFHHEQTVSVWDGVVRLYTEPGNGYTDIFVADTELSEIAPLRSGNFLVAERWNDIARGAKLIEFNLQGRVAEYTLPPVIDAMNDRALGAMHIEVLADQCTVLYTLGNDDPSGNRVRRFNVCTQQPQTDFAMLIAGEYAGSVRQLRNGDVVVANGSAILQFSSRGSLLRSYQSLGVTHLALTPDGNSFWSAGVGFEMADLRRFNPSDPDDQSQSIQLGNDEMQTLVVPLEVSDLVVVGEWRTASSLRRTRAVRP